MNWKLVAKSEPIEGQTIVIDRDMVIGRHQQADVVLQAGHVSRRHAALLLKADGQELWIQDLQSSNGTFVNGVQIAEQQLFNGDEINFETIRFQILADALVFTDDQAAPDLEKVAPSDAGMPTLKERGDVTVKQDGMPSDVGVPKPAPIPEGVGVGKNAQIKSEPIIEAIKQPESRVEKAQADSKNAKVGFMSLIILVIMIVLAGFFYLGQ